MRQPVRPHRATSIPRRQLPHWLLLAALTGALTVAGCEPRTYVPDEVVRAHRADYPLGQFAPGYVRRSVSRGLERATRIVHKVEVRPEVAGELLIKPAGERSRLIAAVACPPGSDPVWGKLTSRQDVEIEISAGKGPIANVDCRSEVR